MILFPLLLWPLAALGISNECLKARADCFDQWQVKYRAGVGEKCAACEEYIECMGLASQSDFCPNVTIYAEDAHEASKRCGIFDNSYGPFKFPDFKKSHETFQRGTYFDMMYEYVYSQMVTYDEASDFCSKAGGSLYTVRYDWEFNTLEERLLKKIILPGPFWIGLNDKTKEGSYRFEDGSKMHWNFFARGHGTNDKGFFGIFGRRREDCVSMDRYGKGYVRECSELLNFVCQYRGTL